ncbi:hypothetical protein OG455_04455 [Kitasatospora sp. NBC_01287]|uniref:CBS domain-containing protein n=1 Tax=Kitasatospora sp. NBC_01287 TaxID=2903573 RepID=UPI00225A19D1|nr:CBS domain-containing protein [Kitasatospora sp. NBC_01287]MCX4744778.1 hypothetical protein [Kitasatospora sp. NBC_01287]
MTRQEVRVTAGTGFQEILTLLTEFDITAVPVVDTDDHPIGTSAHRHIGEQDAWAGPPYTALR